MSNSERGKFGKGKRTKSIARRWNIYDPSKPFSYKSAHQEERMQQFMTEPTKKEVVSSIAPHAPTLNELGCYETVDNLLMNAGLLVWEELMDRPTHNTLVYEFFSSWEPILNDRHEYVGWSFEVNGEVIEVFRSDLEGEWFSPGGVIPFCTDDMRLSTWRKLTGLVPYDPNCSPKCFKDGSWKYIHRLISTNINTRCDQGARVSREDMDIIYFMERGDSIDWFHYLSERFTKMINSKERSKALGCTSLITKLAEMYSYRFRSHDDMRVLDTQSLVNMHLLDRKTREWIVERQVPKRADRKGKKKMGEGSSCYDWEEF